MTRGEGVSMKLKSGFSHEIKLFPGMTRSEKKKLEDMKGGGPEIM